MHFLKDMCICCQQDCPKLQPKVAQDTHLLGELALVWISTYVPQGGNVELNKLGAELHRGRAALTAVTSPLALNQPGWFSSLLKGCHFLYHSVAPARLPSHCLHLGHLRIGSNSHCLWDRNFEDLRKEQSCVTHNGSRSLPLLLLPFSLTLPLVSRDRGSIQRFAKSVPQEAVSRLEPTYVPPLAQLHTLHPRKGHCLFLWPFKRGFEQLKDKQKHSGCGCTAV